MEEGITGIVAVVDANTGFVGVVVELPNDLGPSYIKDEMLKYFNGR